VDAVSENDSKAPRTLGQTLTAERERLGLSRADVAQRLHMSAWQIEALETGDYSRLPKGTFLRGFVRNYAKTLGIPAEAVLSLLDGGRANQPAQAIVVPTQNIRFDPMSERFSSPYVKASAYAFVALAAGFAVMYWWMYVRPTMPGAAKKPAPEQVVNAPPPSVAEPLVPKQATAPAPRQATPPAPQPADAPNVAALAPIETRASALPAPRGREKTLKFRFKGESWVEVRDGRGKVLLQRLNAPGSEAEITGRPPLNVVVGNAPDVEMSMNDEAYNLEPHTRIAVARFTLQ
jgi:cytoskeleton protein RodZ